MHRRIRHARVVEPGCAHVGETPSHMRAWPQKPSLTVEGYSSTHAHKQARTQACTWQRGDTLQDRRQQPHHPYMHHRPPPHPPPHPRQNQSIHATNPAKLLAPTLLRQ